MLMIYFICFFKQKTAYEMRISDWSSDVCSSDLQVMRRQHPLGTARQHAGHAVEDLGTRPAAAFGQQGRKRLRDIAAGEIVHRRGRHRLAGEAQVMRRSERSRVGKECVRTCRSRGCTYHSKQPYQQYYGRI